MKKRILCFVLTMAMVLSMLVVLPAATVSAESDVPEVHISTAAELAAFRDSVNTDGAYDAGGAYELGVNVYLEADIDISGSNWTPIGNSTAHAFKGNFYGQGHTIRGLVQSRGSTKLTSGACGFFGYVSSFDGGSTTISNFKLTSSGDGIKGTNGAEDIGTVVSQVRSSTTGVVTVNVIGVWSTVNFDNSGAAAKGVGGIVGDIGYTTGAMETILNVDSCRYSGTLDSPSAGSNDYGGIVGWTRENISPKSFYITNCLFDGVISLYGSSPDDNGGIIGYLKGNTNSSKVICHVENCIVAGQFKHPNRSDQTVTGYIVSEQSGSNTDYQFTNVYYCNDSDRHTGGAMGGWYGYMKGGSTVPSTFTVSNVTAKTMTELKAMTSGFADDTKWYFGESTQLPVPEMIYTNFLSAPGLFDDMTKSEFVITSDEEMEEFANLVTGGTDFAGKTIKLGTNVALNTRIGYTGSSGNRRWFSGSFDGQGHTVTITQSFSNPDGDGGLFSMVRIPADSTIYIKDVHVTGTITLTNTTTGKGYTGGLISSVDASLSGNGGTINITNVWNTVRINCGLSNASNSVSGFIGFVRHEAGVKPITINIDSCLWDGVINSGPAMYNFGGFVAYTGNNITGRQPVINITNSISAGTFMSNINEYNQQFGTLTSYLKGSSNSTDDTAKVTVNISDVISITKATFSKPTGSGSKIGLVQQLDGNTELNLSNIYYKSFARTGVEGDFPVVADGEAATSDNVAEKTTEQLLNLTTSDFTDSSKWVKPDASGDYRYYPCPAGLVSTFGNAVLAPLGVEQNDINIGTAEALNALATAVNGGKDYAGKTIHITADITIESGWTSIGITSSKPFSGNFNGHGHTIEIHQTLSNPDGVGGLISFVRTPVGGEVTIENLHLTGQINATNSNTGSGYFGGLVSTVDGNTSGNGGIININNVWNSIYINCGNANMWTGVGGFIGFTRHADGLKPLTINFDSCVWDGTLNVGPAAYHFGGYVGYTGNNKAGRTLTINIENSIASGTIALNITWDQYAGLLVGYVRGGYSSDATAKVTVNVNNVISNGKMTFKTGAPGSGSKIGHIGRIDDTTNNEINLTNLYYNPFERGNLEGNAPALDGTANSESNVVAKSTKAELYAITASALGSDKWIKETNYVACPIGISETFGEIPEGLRVNAWEVSDEISIGTAAEFLAFRDAVNDGNSMAGKTITLTEDIDLAGENWVSIGVPGNTSGTTCKPFQGTFDGQGHTISNMTTFLEPTSGYVDMQGGLFSSLADGAVVKNFTLTGTYTVHNISTSTGTTDYFGSVANAVKGTVLIQNVKSSVNITTSVSKNSNNAWPGAVERVAGIVGFIYHNCSADLTIDGCTYSGTINTGNQAIDFAGIMAHTGNNSNGSTKVVTIQNCAFTGRMTVNQNESYAMQGIAGIISHVTGNATVTITGTYSAGKIYFNGSKNWPVVDSDSNPVKMGQILGYNDDGTTVIIDDTVTYTPAKLNKTSGDDSTKYILPEAGRLNGVYAADTAAREGGMEASFEARNINDTYKGIRFKATFFAPSSCTGGGTQSANFGIYLLTLETYNILGGDQVTKAQLDAAGSTVVQVKATKYQDNTSNYVVSAVVYNLNSDARKATELVAIPYMGSDLGNAVSTTYNAVFN